MEDIERIYLTELLDLSVQANCHEDTLLLLITLNGDEPAMSEQLLEQMNSLFMRFGKTPWGPEDLQISKGLLQGRGMIEPDG